MEWIDWLIRKNKSKCKKNFLLFGRYYSSLFTLHKCPWIPNDNKKEKWQTLYSRLYYCHVFPSPLKLKKWWKCCFCLPHFGLAFFSFFTIFFLSTPTRPSQPILSLALLRMRRASLLFWSNWKAIKQNTRGAMAGESHAKHCNLIIWSFPCYGSKL